MNRYLVEAHALPTREELVSASALLCARPDLARCSSAEEVALAEYAHYSTQTYVFEMVGFQLLGEMTAKLRRFDFVHELASQALDEAQHAQAYRDVVRQLPSSVTGSLESAAKPIYDAFVPVGTIEEKVVTSYFVLESVAMGIFAARQRYYRTSSLARLDHEILTDEAQHQGMGVRIAAELIKDGRLDLEQVGEIMREASDAVTRVLEPAALFERFGVGDGARERERILSAGFLAMQRTTSRKAMLNAVRNLRRQLDAGRGELRACAA